MTDPIRATQQVVSDHYRELDKRIAALEAKMAPCGAAQDPGKPTAQRTTDDIPRLGDPQLRISAPLPTAQVQAFPDPADTGEKNPFPDGPPPITIGHAQPTAQGDEAAVRALACVIGNTTGDMTACSRQTLAAIRAGKVPGVYTVDECSGLINEHARALNERDKALAQLAAERERREKAETANDAFVSIRKMHAEDGRFDFDLNVSQSVICAMCDALQPLLKDAKNYTECSLSNKAGESYTVRIQKKNGKTPHELRVEADRERDAARAQVAALMPVLEAAAGLCMGGDWNNGTMAKTHGYRQKLIDAVAKAKAALAAAGEK